MFVVVVTVVVVLVVELVLVTGGDTSDGGKNLFNYIGTSPRKYLYGCRNSFYFDKFELILSMFHSLSGAYDIKIESSQIYSISIFLKWHRSSYVWLYFFPLKFKISFTTCLK